MQKKSVQRYTNREKSDKTAGIIGDSGRNKKLMQGHFEGKEDARREAKRLRLDTSNRGINWHQESIATYKKGALHISKDNIAALERGDLSSGYQGGTTIKLRPEERKKKEFSFKNIQKVREDNPEHMQGKKY